MLQENVHRFGGRNDIAYTTIDGKRDVMRCISDSSLNTALMQVHCKQLLGLVNRLVLLMENAFGNYNLNYHSTIRREQALQLLKKVATPLQNYEWGDSVNQLLQQEHLLAAIPPTKSNDYTRNITLTVGETISFIKKHSRR